jgi:hypothetical protein
MVPNQCFYLHHSGVAHCPLFHVYHNDVSGIVSMLTPPPSFPPLVLKLRADFISDMTHLILFILFYFQRNATL